MDSLRDMGRFPLPVYAGATGNVLATIALTFLVHGRDPQARTLAASANMGFWISLSWLAFSLRRDRRTLAAMLLLALVCTGFPAWIRLFRGL